MSDQDTQALLALKAWAKGKWSQLRPRSVLPEEIQARTALLAEEAEWLYGFTTNYPGSPWTPALQFSLGRHFRQRGRYSRALQLWRAAWESTKDFAGGQAKEIADGTLAHYTELLSSLGRYQTLTSLFAETEGRILPFGSDAQYYLRSLEAYSHMGLNPGKSYRCGTYALSRVARALQATNTVISALGRIPSPATGFTLKQLADLGGEHGLGIVPVYWENTPQLVVPSVIHWKENHYAAIVERHGGWFKVADPTFDEHPVMLRFEDIVAEASGYFLVPENRVPGGWRRAGSGECENVHGQGYVTVVGDQHDEPVCPFGSSPGGVAGTAPSNSAGGSACAGRCGSAKASPGMPFWAVSEPYINVWIFDTPLHYQPSVGPEVAVRLMWRQRGLDLLRGYNLGQFTSFGGGWCSPCRAAVYPVSFDDSGYAVGSIHFGSGAHLSVEFANWGTTSGHNYFNNITLERIVDPLTHEETSYVVHYPDGSRDVYGMMATNSFGFVSRYCLSAKVDPQGHQSRIEYLAYDPEQGKTFVSRIVDPDEHALNFSYLAIDMGDWIKTDLVGGITDWAGRTVRFKYDPDYFTLTEIVDAAGITNHFEYDPLGWITKMVTPYGTTSFDHYQIRANHAETRYVTVSEPNGARQRFWYESADSSVPDPLDPLGNGYTRPSGTPFGDSFATWVWDRNSYHWDARNYEALSASFQSDPAINPPTATDRLLGRGRHWLGNQLEGGADTHTLGAERDPSPNGLITGQLTWYNYEGKRDSDYQGTQILPAVVARVMPDGSTWYEQFTRNDFGLVTQTTEKWDDNGHAFYRSHAFAYDENGVDLLTHYGPDGALVVGYGYDPDHPHVPVRMTNALNEITYYSYDGLNRLVTTRTPADLRTTNFYGEDGYLKMVIDAMGATPFRTNYYTYLKNYPFTHTDERNLTVIHTYDNLGRLLRVDYPDGTFEQDLFSVSSPYPSSTGGTAILDRTGHRDRLGNWTYYAWTANRQLASATDARNNVTAYGYCTCGSLDSVTNAWNTPAQEVTRYAYDSQGKTIATFPPLGSGIFNTYDLLGRLIIVTDAAGTVDNSYDNLGRLTAVRDAAGQVAAAVYDVSNRIIASRDRNGVATANSYDDLGRLMTRTYPDGGMEIWGYAQGIASPTAYVNQLGKVWGYAYDAAGRKTNEIGFGVYTNRFTYGAAGDLLSLTDGKGQVTAWNYDEYGRVTNKLDQAGVEILRYSYDASGRLTRRWTRAKGDTVYAYDPVGSLISIDYSTSPDVRFEYDELNRVALMIDAAGTTRYAYWPGGFLRSEDGPWVDDTVTYGYTDARLRSAVILQQPAGMWTTAFEYDPARRLADVRSPAGTFKYSYSPGLGGIMSSAALVTRLSLPNNSYITNTYDAVARQTGTHLNSSLDLAINGHDYAYNEAGQRTRQTRIDGSYVDYSYDDIGQLIASAAYSPAGTPMPAEQVGYAYDAAWNLAARVNINDGSTANFAVDVKNQLTASPVGACAYDENGNLTSAEDGYITYSYDDENQLATVSSLASSKTEFVYDGRGRLRKRVEYAWNPASGWVEGSETRYIYDGMRVIQERDGSNTPTVSYTRGTDLSGSLEGAGGIGGLLARSHGYSAGTWSTHNFYHADANGNITCLIDADQNPVALYRYDPFGNTISSSGPLASANVYRFSSKEIHAGTGMYYYGYRFYDPSVQRWINRDPIEENGGFNLYNFVFNDPIDWADYSGLACGISFRRYPVGGGHQWIHSASGNRGFYPPGTWIDENDYANQAGRLNPDDPNNYYEWDSERKSSGSLPDGTPCSSATCAQIQACIDAKTQNNAGTPEFNSLFNNCRQRSKRTSGDCCLKKGKQTNHSNHNRGFSGRGSADTTFAIGFSSGSSR